MANDATAAATGTTALTSGAPPASPAGAQATGTPPAVPLAAGGSPNIEAAAQKAAEDKAAADKAAAEKASEIQLKLPEGVKADAPEIAEFSKLAKELGLKSEGAQKVYDLYSKVQKAASESQTAGLEKTVAGWAEALKTDKEFGGADFEKNAQLARKAVLKFAGADQAALDKFLEETSLGNHPLIAKLFWRVGKAIAEDTVGGSNGAGSSQTRDRNAELRARYPNSPEMFKE